MLEENDSGSASLIKTGAAGASAGGGVLCYSKATPLAAGDRLGYNLFGSRGGADTPYNAAGFSAHASAAWTAGTSHPTYFRFDTCPSGSTNQVERVRIDADGNLGVGVTVPTAKGDFDGAVKVKSYTVAGVPSAATIGAGAIIYVSNEVGGAVLAFSDGTNWRRVTDRAVVA